MAGTGADLENSSIQWVDKLEALGDGTKTAQNAILANSVEQMLGELRKSYTKLADEKAKDPNSRAQVYTSQQLANRIENTIELLPSWKRKELSALYDSELKKADRMGRESGVDLNNILKNRDKTLNQNAKPNIDAINAANRRLNQFWQKENSQFTDRVKAMTRNAAAQGTSWRQLSKQIRELLILEEKQGTQSDRSKKVNKRYGIPGRAEMIAKTELSNAFIQGKIDNYRGMGYDHVRWSAAAERTCGFCMSRDGLVYPMEEIEGAIPAHPRCRCDLIPVEVPDDLKGKKITPEQASKELDDGYWAKSRSEKLRRWKEEQNLNSKGQPKLKLKSNSELDQALRNYAQTPTNTQNYLRPGQPASPPLYAPSGSLIPDLDVAAQATQKVAEQAKGAEKKRLEDEAKRVEDEARKAEEAKKAANDAKKAQENETPGDSTADAIKKDQERLRIAKGQKSQKTKAARDEYLKDIETISKNFKISNADARGAYAKAAKQTGYKNGKTTDEDIEDNFLIARQKAAKAEMAKYEEAKNAATKLKQELEAKRAAEASKKAAAKPAGRANDGLKPKESFQPKMPELKSTDFNKLPVKDQNALLKLLHPGRARYYKDMQKLGKGKLSEGDIYGLQNELGTKVYGNEWARNATTRTPEGRAELAATIKPAWAKANSKRMSSKELDAWVKDSNPNFAGDMYKLDFIDGPNMKQFQKFFKEVETAGGNVTALRAMAKMMREQDLMIAWGGVKPGQKSASPESDAMKADPRAERFRLAHGNKSALPAGSTFGHTSGITQYVGMNTYQPEYFPFKTANMDGVYTRKLVTQHLEELAASQKLSYDMFEGSPTQKTAMYQAARQQLVGRNWSTSVRIAERMETGSTAQINSMVASKNMVTLLHELGHQMQYWADKRADGRPMTFTGTGNGKLLTNAKLPGGREKANGTEYSKSNPMEQFAEDWVFYTMDREALRKIKPKTVDHLDEMLEKIFTNDHLGNAPTYDEMMKWRPKLGTTNGESISSGTTNASEVS